MAVWLFMILFMPLISQALAQAIVPDPSTAEGQARYVSIVELISRLSPSTLFAQTVSILLDPTERAVGLIMESQPEGLLPSPLGLDQSLNLIWPHITTIFALVAVCFGISYIIFMRAEIRA
jgi:ABC-2 type transport system permease protein